MPEKLGHVVDLGRVKVHSDSGCIGKVVDEASPRGQRFSHYRLVLELMDGTRREFLFMELRDPTEAEMALFDAKAG